MPAREHAHVVGRLSCQVEQPVEVAALKQDALRVGETRLGKVGRVVIDDGDGEAHVRGKGRNLGRGIGCAEQPYAHLVEQGDGKPGQAFELLVMHARAARGVLHLEHVAGARRARGDDFLGVVAEEDHVAPVGRANVAVLLRHLVVGVGLRGGRIPDHLEAEPGEVALF